MISAAAFMGFPEASANDPGTIIDPPVASGGKMKYAIGIRIKLEKERYV